MLSWSLLKLSSAAVISVCSLFIKETVSDVRTYNAAPFSGVRREVLRQPAGRKSLPLRPNYSDRVTHSGCTTFRRVYFGLIIRIRSSFWGLERGPELQTQAASQDAASTSR